MRMDDRTFFGSYRIFYDTIKRAVYLSHHPLKKGDARAEHTHIRLTAESKEKREESKEIIIHDFPLCT